jgi:hypothetical protein
MPNPISSIEIGSGVVATVGAGFDENVALPAALKVPRNPEPLSANDGTTDERANDKSSVIIFGNCTNAELYVMDPTGGVDAESVAPVPPLLPESVAFAPEAMVPESRFVWPAIGVFRVNENVPVNPPSETMPVVGLYTSGVLLARFTVSVAESGPVRPAGSPVIFEKTKKIWLDAVSVTPDPVSTR